MLIHVTIVYIWPTLHTRPIPRKIVVDLALDSVNMVSQRSRITVNCNKQKQNKHNSDSRRSWNILSTRKRYCLLVRK